MKQIIKTDEIPKNRQQSCIQQLNKQIEQQKIEKKPSRHKVNNNMDE